MAGGNSCSSTRIAGSFITQETEEETDSWGGSESEIDFDCVAVTFEEDELELELKVATVSHNILRATTPAKKQVKPSSKSSFKYTYSPQQRGEESVIDIAMLCKNSNIYPIPMELDIKCRQDCVPIVYDESYNVQMTRPRLQLPPQMMLLDKPAQVFSKINGEYYKNVKAADISSFYDISSYISSSIRQLDVVRVAEMMMLKLSEPLTVTWDDFSSVVLRPLRYQMMGSVLACKLAMEEGWAINIGGGFGHYTTNVGGGLSVYDDVLVCLAVISNLPEVEHIMVVNVDAYQLPCYKLAKNINCAVTIVDVYSEPIPETTHGLTGVKHSVDTEHNIQYHDHRISVGFDVPTSCMYSTLTNVSKYLYDDDLCRPSLCIYVAGTNVLADNPHTKMKFTIKHVVRRDEQVFKLMREHKVPIAILMGGGYQSCDVEASAASIQQILTEHCHTYLYRKSCS